MAYIIKNWEKHFESSETRKLKTLLWVKIPNRQDSLAYKIISSKKDGASIFAAWILMVQVASKQEKRGELPFTPDDLSIITGFPSNIFKIALEVLKEPKIDWIRQSPDVLGESPSVLGESPDREKEGKEGIEKPLSEKSDLEKTFEIARKSYPGAKNGFRTEFEDLRKKHKDLEIAIPLMYTAIEKEKAHKKALKDQGIFCPEWKNFKTWLSQRCWEQELPDVSIEKIEPYKRNAQDDKYDAFMM